VLTSVCKLYGRITAGLVVADQAQDLAETRHGQQATVLGVCNLPYLAQDCGCKLGALEELDGDFACDDAELLCIGLLEEMLEDALLLGREVEDGLVCAGVSVSSMVRHVATAATAAVGCRARTRGCVLSSPLPERSAMRVEGEGLKGARSWMGDGRLR
jgi:hypothetical protein